MIGLPMTSRHSPGKSTAPAPRNAFERRLPRYYLSLLTVAIVVCFFPLLKYFFAQDDFILMHNAVVDPGGAFMDFFRGVPGHFRPLTKAAYFSVMHAVFGLNATPYHFLAFMIHALNVCLTFVLLRRLRVAAIPALSAVTLYALSTGFFHVLAWISCIQQLAGMTFALSSIIVGLDAIAARSKPKRYASVALYVLALLSLEQTWAVPVLIAIAAFARAGGGRSEDAEDGRSGARRVMQLMDNLAEHFAVLIVYLLMMLVWKKTPEEGGYVFSYGTNLVVNLTAYLSWSFHYGIQLPTIIPWESLHFSKSLIALVALAGWLVARRRFREMLFGFGFFLLTISPALPLTNHSFYLHTYVSSFGIIYLIAVAAQDLLNTARFRGGKRGQYVLGAILAVMLVVSFVMVRKNEDAMMHGGMDHMNSFVLRRANIAKNVMESTVLADGFDPDGVERVYMIYGRQKMDEQSRWNNRNVVEALGRGTAIRLFYGRLNMPVFFWLMGDEIPAEERATSHIYFYDDFGHCVRYASF